MFLQEEQLVEWLCYLLGIIPYISSSIIVQLLTGVSDYFKNLKAQGEQGRQKITQITRYGTVLLATIQGFGLAVGLESSVNLVINPILFKITTVTLLLQVYNFSNVAGQWSNNTKEVLVTEFH